ncbi:MAG: type II toxin-antitoxin system VapC family toxin [Parvularculaceae bacterium]
MILVDTSVWVDFLRNGDPAFAEALEAGRVLSHPFVIGEIALGHIKKRDEVLALLSALPKAVVASDDEAMALIRHQRLFGRGIGYIDAHLLASARLSCTMLYTRDKKLRIVAEELDLTADLR